MENNFTQDGTFDLTGVTVTLSSNDVGDDTTLTCGTAIQGNIILNKPTAGADTTLGGNCTIAGDFTRTDGVITNPASAYTLTVQGNFSMSTTDTFGGGSNLTLALTGTGNQTITQNAGTMSGVLSINKSAGSVKLATALTTGLACDVVEGVFDLEGRAFTCGSTFTLQDGGTLRATGREAFTSPTVQTGSTIHFDESSIATFLPDITYSNLVIGSTGSTVFTMTAATLDVNKNLTISGGTLTITNAQNIALSGSWIQSGNGSFSAGTGTVTLDGGDQTLSGTTVFNNLSKTVTVAKTLTFSQGGQQSISGALTLQGAASNLLSIRGETAATASRLILDGGSGTQTIEYLDVKDNDASGGAELACSTSSEGCVNSGNNTNWSFRTTRTWDAGGTDTNWSTAENWSGDTVPIADDIALFDGTGKKDAIVDDSFAGMVYALTVTASHTGSITLSRSLTLSGSLTHSGSSTTGITWTAGEENDLYVIGNLDVHGGANIT